MSYPQELDKPFPHAPRRKLTSPPIELIIAQARFPTVASLYARDGFIKFAESIAEQYPDARALDEVSVEVAPGQTRETHRVPVWKFDTIDASATVTLTPDFVALETKEYADFTLFGKQFSNICTHLATTVNIKHRTRLGLRYVDQVHSKKYPNLTKDWCTKLRRESTPLAFADRDSSVFSHIAQVFSLPNDILLHYRATLESPQDNTPDAGSVFTLDLDASDSSQKPLIAELEAALGTLKELTHNAFYWTLTEVLESANLFEDQQI